MYTPTQPYTYPTHTHTITVASLWCCSLRPCPRTRTPPLLPGTQRWPVSFHHLPVLQNLRRAAGGVSSVGHCVNICVVCVEVVWAVAGILAGICLHPHVWHWYADAGCVCPWGCWGWACTVYARFYVSPVCWGWACMQCVRLCIRTARAFPLYTQCWPTLLRHCLPTWTSPMQRMLLCCSCTLVLYIGVVHWCSCTLVLCIGVLVHWCCTLFLYKPNVIVAVHAPNSTPPCATPPCSTPLCSSPCSSTTTYYTLITISLIHTSSYISLIQVAMLCGHAAVLCRLLVDL